MQQRFKQLKCNNSLRLEDGIPVIWPKQEKPGRLKASTIIKSVKDKKAYAFNNAVIAFVSEGELYVTPYSEESLSIIRDSGYKLHIFFVPFSNGDKPLGEYGEKWQALVAKIRPFSRQAAPTA
ncbi:MAG: hypothetical protein Q4F56_02045 [Candidatus Saccharibacteria bacterium]|nr:hypothetical protein [Candidatus Saccharibacteria bacterium]